METLKKIKFSMLIIGALIFTYLFWKEGVGLNFFFFHIFFTVNIFIYYKNFYKTKSTLITFLSSTLIVCFIVIYSSSISIVMYFISMILFVGFLHQPQIKLTFFSIFTSLNDYFNFFKAFKYGKKNENKKRKKDFSKFGRFLKTAVIPIIALIIFYFIFKYANPVFEQISSNVFNKIGDFFRHIFENISFAKIFFTLWGFTLIAWILYNSDNDYFKKIEQKFSNVIVRQRKSKAKDFQKPDEDKVIFSQTKNLKMSLKNEFRTAIMLVLSINVLLLIINIIDINWIWFGFEWDGEFNLKQFVHEGTYLLILSILLSMGIMIFYFRRNLNFYPKSQFLRILCYLWIFQNAILTISVMIRNYHYINYFDLAYKRIGLIIFLILVLFGLFTLFVKIKNKKSGYYLFRINSWAMYLVMTLMTFVNWDKFITEYNLSSKNNENVDVRFLLKMNDNVLPVLQQNTKVMFKNPENLYYQEKYIDKIKNFIDEYEKNTWKSWNYADYKTYQYFNNLKSNKSENYEKN